MKGTMLVLALASMIACGSKSPTSPSPAPTPTAPAPTPPAPPALVGLTGFVATQAGPRLSGATVLFLDGPNQGKAVVTDGSGVYQFSGLQPGDTNLSARGAGFEEVRRGINVNGTNSLNFTLRTAQPWTRSGSGDNVFDMPTYITRVRITATYPGFCQNFAVKVAGRLLVNVIIGTCSVADARAYDGTHVVSGGVVETQISSGVNWTFTEAR